MSTYSISISQAPILIEPQPSFQKLLSGTHAFYTQSNYLEATQADFASSTCLPASYTSNTEIKIVRIAKLILSIIIFPIGIYKLIHGLIGKIVVLSSNIKIKTVDEDRSNINLDYDWKYKRITIAIDGYKIDAMIVGKPSTFNNGRWVLASNGNGELYEETLVYDSQFRQILSEIKGNGIVFNYPGVGSSTGLPNRKAMANAYRAMLNFLEDQKIGIGAKEIIGYGHSIGGGVQGDALNEHELKPNVKYVFVKNKTFSNLSTTVSCLLCRPIGFLIWIFGWNIDSVNSSKKIQVPEIIIQTTCEKVDAKEIGDSSNIVCDGPIHAKASLAKALLDDPSCPKDQKTFIGTNKNHNSSFDDVTFLTDKIKQKLL